MKLRVRWLGLVRVKLRVRIRVSVKIRNLHNYISDK